MDLQVFIPALILLHYATADTANQLDCSPPRLYDVNASSCLDFTNMYKDVQSYDEAVSLCPPGFGLVSIESPQKMSFLSDQFYKRDQGPPAPNAFWTSGMRAGPNELYFWYFANNSTYPFGAFGMSNFKSQPKPEELYVEAVFINRTDTVFYGVMKTSTKMGVICEATICLPPMCPNSVCASYSFSAAGCPICNQCQDPGCKMVMDFDASGKFCTKCDCQPESTCPRIPECGYKCKLEVRDGDICPKCYCDQFSLPVIFSLTITTGPSFTVDKVNDICTIIENSSQSTDCKALSNTCNVFKGYFVGSGTSMYMARVEFEVNTTFDSLRLQVQKCLNSVPNILTRDVPANIGSVKAKILFDNSFEPTMSMLNKSPCLQPRRPKPCPLGQSYSIRYEYNKENGLCRPFAYDGCQTDSINAFKTKKECESTCQLDRCYLPVQPGICKAFMPRYAYDIDTGKCVLYIYGGCGGNANNFATESACMNACDTVRCRMPIDEGSTACYAHSDLTKWYHIKNDYVHECRSGPYSGCLGNTNRFNSKQECQQACMKDTVTTTASTITTSNTVTTQSTITTESIISTESTTTATTTIPNTNTPGNTHGPETTTTKQSVPVSGLPIDEPAIAPQPQGLIDPIDNFDNADISTEEIPVTNNNDDHTKEHDHPTEDIHNLVTDEEKTTKATTKKPEVKTTREVEAATTRTTVDWGVTDITENEVTEGEKMTTKRPEVKTTLEENIQSTTLKNVETQEMNSDEPVTTKAPNKVTTKSTDEVTDEVTQDVHLVTTKSPVKVTTRTTRDVTDDFSPVTENEPDFTKRTHKPTTKLTTVLTTKQTTVQTTSAPVVALNAWIREQCHFYRTSDSYCTCELYGDPLLDTYDGYRAAVQGLGSYLLSYNPSKQSQQSFRLIAELSQADPFNFPAILTTGKVAFKFLDTELVIEKDKILMYDAQDPQPHYLTLPYDDQYFNMTGTPGQVMWVMTAGKISLLLDFTDEDNVVVAMSVPKSFLSSGGISGFCRDCDGNAENDCILYTPDGSNGSGKPTTEKITTKKPFTEKPVTENQEKFTDEMETTITVKFEGEEEGVTNVCENENRYIMMSEHYRIKNPR